MPQFSDSEINEAKRRVREMRNKASRYIDANEEKPEESESPQNTCENPKGVKGNIPSGNPLFSLFSSGESGDGSSLIILILIMILSKEKADSTLIFALLYLLL